MQVNVNFLTTQQARPFIEGISINAGNGVLRIIWFEKAKLLPGDTKGESRLRTFTKEELQLMFSCITDKKFNQFVQFAYYTGARSGEIRALAQENVQDDSIIVRGKTGRRIVKLNNQAKKVIGASR